MPIDTRLRNRLVGNSSAILFVNLLVGKLDSGLSHRAELRWEYRDGCEHVQRPATMYRPVDSDIAENR